MCVSYILYKKKYWVRRSSNKDLITNIDLKLIKLDALVIIFIVQQVAICNNLNKYNSVYVNYLSEPQ